MSDNPKRFYEFGPFRLDESGRRLLRAKEDGECGGRVWEEVPLQRKVFDVLLSLIRQSRELIGRDRVLDEVWRDTHVEPHRVTANISTLRAALGDDKNNPRYIRTVPGEGYRFVADVREVVEEPVAVFEQTRSSVVVEEEGEVRHAEAPRPAAAGLPAGTILPERGLGAGGVSSRRLGWAIALACLLVGALAAWLWYARRDDGARPPHARTVAVLPFKPLVAESRDPALELGMTDALISKLSSIRQLTVRPTSAVVKYAAEGQDLRAAGSELKVDVLLDGKVQRAGDRVRLTVQLVRAADGATVWAEKFDEKFTDIFAVQDAVSERAAAALALKLTGEERRGLAKRYTDNAEAYQLYLQGREHWGKFTHEGRQTSINYYNEALRLDPDYALAHAGLADAYIVTGIYGPPTPAEVMPKAQEAIRRALALDDELAEAHVSYGALKIFYERDWPGAERELKRAMELNPNNVDAHELYGYYLAAVGRTEEALASHKRARELAPRWHVVVSDLLDAYFFARRYDEAIEECREVLRLEPNNLPARLVLGKALNQKGLHEEAAAELRRGLAVPAGEEHRRRWILEELGYTYAVAGRRGEAARVIEQLRAKPGPWVPMQVGKIYAGMGDRDQAFAWLTRAADELFPFLYELKADPHYDGLRADPRFAELLRRIKLAP